MKKILCSGGFDPLHVGHLYYLTDAYYKGRVVVALNSDAWLMRKKGYVFMPWKDRALILAGLSCITSVYPVVDEDDTVCAALRLIVPDYYANGGDRIEPLSAEDAVCKELGIEQLFNIGGDKIHSSSKLVEAVR